MARELIYIANDGALFTGVTRGYPEKVYDAKSKSFVPYEGEVPKPIDWGEIVDDETAKAMMETLDG